ncbi:hypothetical protein Tco_0760069 [Tanacetum coccineum]
MANHYHWELITSGGWLLALAHRLYQAILAFGSVVDDYCNDLLCLRIVAGELLMKFFCRQTFFLLSLDTCIGACLVNFPFSLLGVPVGPVVPVGISSTCSLSCLASRSEMNDGSEGSDVNIIEDAIDLAFVMK